MNSSGRGARGRRRLAIPLALALALALLLSGLSLPGQGVIPEAAAGITAAPETAGDDQGEPGDQGQGDGEDKGKEQGDPGEAGQVDGTVKGKEEGEIGEDGEDKEETEDNGKEAAGTERRPANRISYRLPTTGELPKTYRVTLAAAPQADPNWLVATFLSGAVRTVTRENQGRFTELWDGLDDNFMPVPPGDYVVRGIYMPATKWHMDDQYHTLIARYLVGVGDSWSPAPDQDRKFPWIFGHCFGYLRDVAVADNGLAAFNFSYIEDSFNPFLVDLKKPIDYDQVQAKYPSGGAGGTYAACDGEYIWAANLQRDFPYVYRTDRKWGDAINQYGVRCIKLKVPAADLCAWYDARTQKRFVYVAQPDPENKVLVYDGVDATLLKEVPIRNPRAVVIDKAAPGSRLHVLHEDETEGWLITSLTLTDGNYSDKHETLLKLKSGAEVLDFDVGSDDRVYLVSVGRSEVQAMDPKTGKTDAFGKTPKPGKYDPQTFYNPQRVAVWKDADGKDRVLVVESGGPGRLSEWSPAGALLRQWFFAHTASYGYCLDPEEPTLLYHVSNANELIRYRMDFGKTTWQVDCVWPMPIGGRLHPQVINRNGNTYVTFPGGALANGGFAVYRIIGDRCVPSAGIIPDLTKTKKLQITKGRWWHDANGDGMVQENEYSPGRAELPGSEYWGDRWLDDLSLAVFAGDGRYQRLPPVGFDDHGNPIYDGSKWQPLLSDPIAIARQGKEPLPLLYGGNELPVFYGLHWIHLDGTPDRGFYVADSFGRNNPGGVDTAGSYFSQVKLNRYFPDGKGGYRLRWRVGRKALRLLQPGELYCSQYLGGEAHGLVGVFDSNGLYHVFNNEGLYVDTVGIDAFRYGLENTGMYAGGGGHWYGAHYQSKKDGRVYLCMGRAQMTVYAVDNWRPELVQPLAVRPEQVRMTAGSIQLPNPIAVALRGGDNEVKVANFHAAVGAVPEPADDDDWAVDQPVKFQLDKDHTVQVECKYDPQTIYLRWHVRLPDRFRPAAVADYTRLFTRESGIDTVSFYIQGDLEAGPSREAGRPGDVRIVFALVKDRGRQVKPVALGLYPAWDGEGEPNPVTYRSPVSREAFAHVSLLGTVRLAHKIDIDEKGFWIAAAVPLQVVPRLKELQRGFHTRVNFEASFGGRTRLRWANVGATPDTATGDDPTAARFYPDRWSQARFVW